MLREWPAEANLCFSACVDLDGVVTVNEPTIRVRLRLRIWLCERHVGEVTFRTFEARTFASAASSISALGGIAIFSTIWLSFRKAQGADRCAILRHLSLQGRRRMRKWTSPEFAWQLRSLL